MKEKTKESVSAVVPIMLIVLLLGFTIAPLSPSILVEFIVGAVLVIIGMVFFSLGAELSMESIRNIHQHHFNIEERYEKGN